MEVLDWYGTDLRDMVPGLVIGMRRSCLRELESYVRRDLQVRLRLLTDCSVSRKAYRAREGDTVSWPASHVSQRIADGYSPIKWLGMSWDALCLGISRDV